MSEIKSPKVTIAWLPGDGIGPEVCEATEKVFSAVCAKFQLAIELARGLVGGAAIDQTGQPLPPETLKICASAKAILFGSVGGPKWDSLPAEQRPEVGALLPLRKKFDLFANLRPARLEEMLAATSPLSSKIIATGFDFLVVRELTGDVYFGQKELTNAFGRDEMIYRKEEVERIARLAFTRATKRRQKVTNVDKANVLATSQFWRKIVSEVHQKEFPEIALEHLYIDNATMQILVRPQDFDVILAGNLFGDILSDEASQIAGSIGLSPSASLNAENFGLFEPMGGSAPALAGRDLANPLAQIRSLALLFEISLQAKEAAQAIEAAIQQTLQAGFRTADIWQEGCQQVGTQEMAAEIAQRI